MMNDFFEPRNLDEIYYRVKRNGEWTNRCFSDLNLEEQIGFLKKYDKEELIRMFKHFTDTMDDMMCNVLNDNECREVVIALANDLRMFGDIFEIVGGD